MSKQKTGDDLVSDVQRGSYGTITVNGETTQIKAERGWEIVPEGIVVKRGWKVFDYYAGWMLTDEYDSSRGHYTRRSGRWLVWAKKKSKSHLI